MFFYCFKEYIITEHDINEKHHLIKGNFPFSVKNSPFYYGWIIIAVGAIGILFSIPGQTMGVSVYTNHLIKNLNLTRVQISMAYMIGTLVSSFLLTFAGIFYDKFGARVAGAGSAFFLGLFLIFLAYSVSITSFLHGITSVSPTKIAFGLMVFGFLGIRFFGQGVLTLVSRGMVMRWFETHRGFAAALMGVFTSFGFSYAPRVLQAIIDSTRWDQSWIIMGLFLIFAVLPFILIFFRDSPEDCQMEMEQGVRIDRGSKNKPRATIRNYTLSEAKRDPQLWFYLLILFFWALFNTAFTFHIVSIFETFGKSKNEAVGIFLPIAFISVIFRLGGSWISDIIKMKNIFYIFWVGCLLGALSIALPYNGQIRILMIIGIGIASGLMGVITSVTWPKLYGREHLGAISGLAMSFMVAGSAIGPWLFSIIEESQGDYRLAGYGGVVYVILLGFVSLPVLLKSKS